MATAISVMTEVDMQVTFQPLCAGFDERTTEHEEDGKDVTDTFVFPVRGPQEENGDASSHGSHVSVGRE